VDECKPLTLTRGGADAPLPPRTLALALATRGIGTGTGARATLPPMALALATPGNRNRGIRQPSSQSALRSLQLSVRWLLQPAGRGSHSSTFQLNLSRVCHKTTSFTPSTPPNTPLTRAVQPLRAPPIPCKALKLSCNVDECKPRPAGCDRCGRTRGCVPPPPPTPPPGAEHTCHRRSRDGREGAPHTSDGRSGASCVVEGNGVVAFIYTEYRALRLTLFAGAPHAGRGSMYANR